jgi:hypothetical protein
MTSHISEAHTLSESVVFPESIRIQLNSRKPIPELALVASTVEDARIDLKKVGYDIGDEDLNRKVDKTTGQGFWDKIIGDLRMVCYGPENMFNLIITTWTSKDEGLTWVYNYCSQGELLIPGGVWHCLVAGEKGLCMDVSKDLKRSINWLDKERSPTWSKTLAYIITIQELKALTETALKNRF